MAKVIDLQPGDRVVNGGRTAVFIARTRHPAWPALELVIWRLCDETICLDALRIQQEVGKVIPVTSPAEQRDQLLSAICGVGRGR